MFYVSLIHSFDIYVLNVNSILATILGLRGTIQRRQTIN